jgi:sulfur-oxidizing protein SoxY
MSTALPRGQTRRNILGAAAGLGLALQLRPVAAVSAAPTLQTVVSQWAAGKPVTEGRVLFDIAPLVENGNAVPISVQVDSPMTAADHVVEIVVFNERNPQRDVARFSLGPANGVAQVQARIRLATSQQLVALARMRDGSQWSHHVDVLVTLAACVEP